MTNLHLRDYIDCVKKRNIEDCVEASIQAFGKYNKKSKERQIAVASNSNGSMRTKQQKLGNRKEKKNNWMDNSSDKLAGSHTRRHRYG